MIHNISFLVFWLRVFMAIAAVCATAFPILYSFSPWYRSRLGRALMLQGAVLALVLDITLLFQFWKSVSREVRLQVYITSFLLIAIATARLTYKLYKINYKTKYEEDRNYGRRSTDR